MSSDLANLSERPPQLQQPGVLIIPRTPRIVEGVRGSVCLLLKSPACATQDDGCNQDSPRNGANDDVGATGTWGGGQDSVDRDRHGKQKTEPHLGQRQSHPYISPSPQWAEM